MQRQGQVLDTSIVSRGKLPLLALVDSFPCCAILSRRTVPSSRKYPGVFFFFSFLIGFSFGFKELQFEVVPLWVFGSIEPEPVN